MKKYEVIFEQSVDNLYRRLPKDVITRLDRAISALADDPRPPGCKKLVGRHDYWRIRVGDWRIVYTIQDDALLVLVIEIAPRGSVYRNL